MARSFTFASSQYLKSATGVVTAAPFTIGGWAQPTANSNGHTSVICGLYGTSVSSSEAYLNTQNAVWNFWMSSGSNWTASSGGTITAGAWTHVMGVAASATSRTVYVNGVAQTPNTQSRVPGAFSETLIGAYDGQAPLGNVSSFWDGLLAEQGAWSVALTANEVAALAAGVNPRFIRLGALVGYWPLWGLASPEPDMSSGGHAMTLVATPPAANHAPVTLWTRRPAIAPRIDVAAAGSYLPYNPLPQAAPILAQ